MSIVSTILTPYKGYLYGALGVLGLSVFGWYTVHERNVAHAEDAKKSAALVAASVALNKASEQLADIKELNIGKVYEKYITLPPIADDPGLVCVNTAPAEQPKAADNRPGADGTEAVVPVGSFNPSGAILTLLSDDDAQINGLIDTVLVLEAELEGKTK